MKAVRIGFGSVKFVKESRRQAILNSNQLRGLKVVVTRPRAQAAEITALLEGLGATVIHCPTIQVVEPSSWEAVDGAIARLQSYDWVVFTSSNGVEFFLRRLNQIAPSRASLMAGLTVCAIGPRTAESLEKAGFQADVVARDSKAEGAFDSIVEQVGGEAKLSGLRFLIPRARVARDFLPVELTRCGAQVDAVETYQTVKPEADLGDLIEMFRRGAIDAITFTSSSTVSNFATLVGADDLSALLHGVVVGCIGPVTAATAAEFGLERVVQPEAYTAAAMVEAMAASMGRKES